MYDIRARTCWNRKLGGVRDSGKFNCECPATFDSVESPDIAVLVRGLAVDRDVRVL